MDKRFKWPLKQRAIYSDAPYHHNPSRGYQRHLHGGHPNQPQHPHQHPGKSYARQQYGYSHGGGACYRKPMPPPPPPVAQPQMGGGAMAPPSSGGSVGAGADMVTLIVENNNLKRMIVLHLKLMQEQTDSLAVKDKELDDQSARMGAVLAQNQELKQAVAKLEAANEDLRKQLRRKNQRRNDDDDDDDDHSLPPAAPQQRPIRCHAETQTVIREREQCTQTIDVQPQLAEVQPRSLHVEEVPAVTHHAGVVTNLPSSKRSESKGRGEFNGKKVSTFILQRMNQDSKHHIQEHSDQPEEQAMQTQEEQLQQEDDHLREEVQLPGEDDHLREEVQLPGEEDHLREEVHLPEDDDHLQMQEVQTEEVVGGDIFHDALESIEMEVVTEEMVVLEEHVQTVDANGHMEEDDEEEEDQENSDEEEDSEEDDEDDEDTQSLDTNSDAHFRTEDDLWQNQVSLMRFINHKNMSSKPLILQISSMELDTTEEKALAPSAHSTPNHLPKSLPHAEVRKEEHQDWKAEKLLQLENDQKQLDQELETSDQMEVDNVKIVSEKKRIEEEKIAGTALKALLLLREAAEEMEKGKKVAEIRKEQEEHQDGATEELKAIKKLQEVPKAELKPHDPPKEHKRQDRQEDARVEQQKEVREEQKEVLKMQPEDAPKQLLKAVAPKVAAVPSPSVRETKLPKANTADTKASPAQKSIANHQSTKTQTDPVKKQRLQVKIRQYEMFSGIRNSSSAQFDARKHKNTDQDPGLETKISKQALVNLVSGQATDVSKNGNASPKTEAIKGKFKYKPLFVLN